MSLSCMHAVWSGQRAYPVIILTGELCSWAHSILAAFIDLVLISGANLPAPMLKRVQAHSSHMNIIVLTGNNIMLPPPSLKRPLQPIGRRYNNNIIIIIAHAIAGQSQLH